MIDAQAYFSLVQYGEIPERAEYVNVGVVLFARAAPYVLSKFVASSRHVDGIPRNIHRPSFFKDMVESLRYRISAEFQKDWTLEAVNRFVETRTGNLRLLQPRSVLAENPISVIDDLYAKLVSSRSSGIKKLRISQKLKNELVERGVEKLLEKPEPIELPQGITMRAPYAYQNGRYNLISGLSLTSNPDQAIEAASAQAVKGDWLYKDVQLIRPARLVVVADVEGQSDTFVHDIAGLMEEHNVGFYRLDNLEGLTLDIRKHAPIHRHFIKPHA